MPPRKKARRASPSRSLSPRNSRTRKVASTAPEDVDDSRRRSERSTRGVGGHVAQLKKAGEILMAPARQRKGRGAVEISDSEVNPMAPSQQLKKGKKKADTNFLPRPVEDDDSQSNTQRRNPFLRMAGPDDRFGFKSSSTDKQDPREATQPIGRSSKKAVGESVEDEARKDRMWDLDERDELENDELENDADEHDHNDRPSEDEDSLLRDTREASVDRMALCGDEDNEGDEDGDTQMDPDQGDFDSRDSGNDTHHEATDTFDVLERHQTKNGRRKAPSPTHLARACSSRKQGSARPRETGSRSRQHSPSLGSRRPSLERVRTSSSPGFVVFNSLY
ncbi:hypothetical protein BDR03DRAFT_1019359 [Suillus americanus]|nr:hypothetical protein BDR03DRAFT_1019359 [Suillus americanus]